MSKVNAEVLQNRLDAILSRIQIVESDEPESAPVCETCGGLGYIRFSVPWGHALWGKMSLCDNESCTVASEIRAQNYKQAMKSSGLPDSYARLTFSTFLDLSEAEKRGKGLALGACWVFAHNRPEHLVTLEDAAAAVGKKYQAESRPKNWIVLQGGLGLGKTGLAAAVVNELSEQGEPVLYMRLQDMFTEIQSRYAATESPSADDVVKRIKAAPVLVLDEFNIPNVSNDKARLVEEIIRYRHGNRIPTIITCNVTPQEFESMWGGRTVDVTLESAHWIELSGVKIRKTDSAIRSF